MTSTTTTDKEFAEYVQKVSNIAGVAALIANEAAMQIIMNMAGDSEKLATGAYGQTLCNLVSVFVEASAIHDASPGTFTVGLLDVMQAAQKRGEYVREQRQKAKAQKPA